MIITTSPNIEGKKIVEYIVIVSGEAVMGANILRDLLASIVDIVGGRSGQYEQKFQEAREFAVNDMEAEAEERGANAIIGVDIDYEMVGDSMMLVTASGTAVKIE